MRVNLPGDCPDRVCCNLLQLRNDFFDDIQFNILRVYVFLKVWIRELVPRFKFAIVITLFLNCIIGQVNESVGHILEIEILAASS
jgi:hypothetical protein